MLRFPFKQHIRYTDLRDKLVKSDDPLYDRSQGSRSNTALPPKMPIHVCTHLPSFQNANKATQFSGSRHFQVCLPAPSSSCFFLPTTDRLASVDYDRIVGSLLQELKTRTFGFLGSCLLLHM